MSLSKLRPFGATFFIFSDYARPAIRLSALMEIADDLRLHARRDGRRRGRPDAPADRAARLAARDARPDAAAPGRRERSGRGVSLRPAAAAPAGGAWCCRASRCRRSTAANYAPAAGVARGAYVLADAPGGNAGGDPDRDRQRGQPRGRGARDSCSRRASARAWCRCRRGTSSSSSRRTIATACCRRRSRRAWRSSRRRRSAGSATSASAAGSIGMQTFGASAPLKALQQEFGFEPDNVVAHREGSAGEKVAARPARRWNSRQIRNRPKSDKIAACGGEFGLPACRRRRYLRCARREVQRWL